MTDDLSAKIGMEWLAKWQAAERELEELRETLKNKDAEIEWLKHNIQVVAFDRRQRLSHQRCGI